MPSITTNRSKATLLGTYFRKETVMEPNGFSIALITSAGVSTNPGEQVAPTPSNCLTWSDCSQNEIPAGNGYVAGGIAIQRGTADWTSLTEDPTNNRAFVTLKNVSWTATGGNLPASGPGAAYAVLMDDTANRNVLIVLDLGGARTVSDTQQLILQNVQYIAT